MVSLESREILVSRETEEKLEFPDPGEKMAPRGQRVASDPLVRSDHLDLLERRVNLGYLDFLAILEDKDLRDRLDSLDSPAQMARREQGVSSARLDQEAKEDQRVLEGREDQGVQQANQELREHQEVTAHLDLLERGGCLDLRELTVSPDQRDLPDPQERMDCPDTLGREEKSVSKERWVVLAVLELLALRVHQERPAPWESVAIQDHQVPLVSRDCPAPQGRRAPRETQVPQEALVRTDPQD